MDADSVGSRGCDLLEMEGRREARVAASSVGLDPMYMACSLFRRRRLEECVEVCTKLLERNPFDQVMRTLKVSSTRTPRAATVCPTP